MSDLHCMRQGQVCVFGGERGCGSSCRCGRSVCAAADDGMRIDDGEDFEAVRVKVVVLV